jgi:hypothetical protein
VGGDTTPCRRVFSSPAPRWRSGPADSRRQNDHGCTQTQRPPSHNGKSLCALNQRTTAPPRVVRTLSYAKTRLVAEELVAFRYRSLLAGVLAFALSMPSGLSIWAESGSYVSDDGPWCYYNETGPTYSVACIGFSRSARGLVHFSCSYERYRLDWSTWSCVDSFGNRWGTIP